MTAKAWARNIAVVAFEGISPFHLSVPCLVFGERREDMGIEPLQLTVCALQPGLLRSSVGLGIQVDHGLAALERAGTIIVPSWGDPAVAPPPAG